MWTGLLWFALLAAAGLCYPRRPRLSGVLWILLGALSMTLSVARDARLARVSGLYLIALGIWYLVKYRKPDVRAKHVEYWTAKA